MYYKDLPSNQKRHWQALFEALDGPFLTNRLPGWTRAGLPKLRCGDTPTDVRGSLAHSGEGVDTCRQ